MGSSRRLPSLVSLLVLWLLAATLCIWAGCDDMAAVAPDGGGPDGGTPDAGSDSAPPDGADDGSSDGEAGSDAGDAADDAPGDAVDDAPGDAACPMMGLLGETCTTDCDCRWDTPCRGLPGDRECSIPCQDYSGCSSAPLTCAENKYCNLSIGACRCTCHPTECDEFCHGLYCVGCSEDEHCSTHSCPPEAGIDQPRCRLDTETCECGGSCGDGVCDPKEQALRSCPSDCPGPCVEGEILPFSCGEGTLVTWCVCIGSQWDCLETDPTLLCPGLHRCDQLGGRCVAGQTSCVGAVALDPGGCTDPEPACCFEQLPMVASCDELGGRCVAGAGDCTDVAVTTEAFGCTAPTPSCCIPLPCLPPGIIHPPGEGMCCRGQRDITALAPMPGYGLDGGTGCETTCWQLTCAPCGDGTCELHFGENPCNCPEDCPEPPYTFACNEDAGTVSLQCGRPFCRQVGSTCHLEIPICNGSECTRDVQDLPDHICHPGGDLDGGLCVPGP